MSVSKQLLDYFVVPVESVYSDSSFVARHSISKEAQDEYESRYPGMVLAGVTRNMPVFDMTVLELVEHLRALYVSEIEYLRQRVDELEEEVY